MRKERRFSHRLEDYDLSDPESKRRYNEELFTPVSYVYPRITKLLSFGRDGAWKRDLVESLAAHIDALSPVYPVGYGHEASTLDLRALDIACGPGDLTFLLAGKFPGARVTGVDLNRDMLERARGRLADLPPELTARVEFLPGDMGNIDVPGETFDIVTGGYALRNAPDLSGTLREILRVLKPGGVAAFLDFSKSAAPKLRDVQLALLSFWGRIWGGLMHGNPEVYGYIAESLRSFPDAAAFLRLLESEGFELQSERVLFFGFLRATVVRKPVS